MSRQLKLEIKDGSSPKEIGVVQGSHVIIGREPDRNGIAVPSEAVSRNHGEFVRLRTNWFFRDLGSTNSSWVNGFKATEGAWKLVRAGDVLQLADCVINISEDSGAQKISGFPALGGISLLVFSKGEFLNEYPVPDYGRALVIGGSTADLQIEGDHEQMSSLVIERRSINVCAFGMSKSAKVLINETLLSGSIDLTDRDEIKVGHYFIIFNYPAQQANKALDAKKFADLQASSESDSWKSWSDEEVPDPRSDAPTYRSAAPAKGVFGQRKIDEELSAEETIAVNSGNFDAKISGYDMHPSMRYVSDEPEREHIPIMDEKIVYIIGSILLIGLVVLMLFWMLT